MSRPTVPRGNRSRFFFLSFRFSIVFPSHTLADTAILADFGTWCKTGEIYESILPNITLCQLTISINIFDSTFCPLQHTMIPVLNPFHTLEQLLRSQPVMAAQTGNSFLLCFYFVFVLLLFCIENCIESSPTIKDADCHSTRRKAYGSHA